ncbi:MAG: hypothetical protein CL955_04545 [Erythrobacteraceae bacterium]|nr:hypothetical protein [Erythrobacteraceae bacterium]
MQLPWRKTAKDKVFVNYRRSDAQGFAGRLADSLTRHFGSERVFRDVTGIDYGADFEQVIVERIEQACAVIVVIGGGWLNAVDDQGNARLSDENDYVVREIEAALAGGIVVVPVLIGGATMPRREELPPRLADLANRNAITISDERWAFDVERLAKVLAIDVEGSVTQSKLDLMRAIALAGLTLLSLFATVKFSVAAVEWADGAETLRLAGYTPLASAMQFFGIILAGVMFLICIPMIEASRRKYALAGVLIATAGTIAPFIHYAVRNVEFPSLSIVVNYAVSMSVAVVMLALVALAGFREK